MSSDESVWFYVKHDDGDVQRLSLEQLDTAFQAGFIDEETLILASNQTQWCKLGQLAGLDDAPAQPAAPPAPVVRAAPMPVAMAPGARAAKPASPPVTYSPPPLPSHRPVSVDLGVLNDAGESLASDPFRSKGGKKKGWAVAVLALAAVAGAGTIVVRQPSWASGALSRIGVAARAPAEPAVAWNAPPPPQPAVAPPPAPAAEPPASTPPSAGPQGTVSGMAPGITMAGSDSRPAGDTDARVPPKSEKTPRTPTGKSHRSRVPAQRPAGHSAKKSSGAFTTSGNKFDPLNSTIQ